MKKIRDFLDVAVVVWNNALVVIGNFLILLIAIFGGSVSIVINWNSWIDLYNIISK